MLGALLALLAGISFAWTNAAVRRGVLTGSAMVATALSLPIGIPLFFLALLAVGTPAAIFDLSDRSMLVFAIVGINHFIVGRYCNYRALKAIGTNLAGPVMQFNLVVSLALALFFLDEKLTPLRIIGIVLVVAGPFFVPRTKDGPPLTVSFTPRYIEGYAFALLASIFYGMSAPLIRDAVGNQGLAASLAGGVVSASAATVLILLLLLVTPSQWSELRRVEVGAGKWFFIGGVTVYISQVFAYAALALAPVIIVAPIMSLANIWRLYFSRWLNPQHEVFGSAVIVGTLVSFLGVVMLSVSGDLQPYVEAALPASWRPFLQWRWP